MKKFLIILFCLSCVQNAYCDNPPFDLDSMNADYLAGRIDLETAIALCKKVINYAKITEIDISFSYTLDDGRQMSHAVNLDDCEPSENWDYNKNLSWVWGMATYAARIVAETGVKEHSQCHQLLMESRAREYYASEMIGMSTLYNFSGATNVDCSKTDNRCVITRLATRKSNKENEFFTVCCLVPVINCDFRTVIVQGQPYQDVSGVTGDISTGWKGYSGRALTLDDFGYDCKPNVE